LGSLRRKRTLFIYNPGEPPYDVETRLHVGVTGLSDGADLNTVFTEFYQINRWGSRETASGEGSERSGMKDVIEKLGSLIRQLGIRSVADAPCGDFNWMRDVSMDGVSYAGYDVVDDLIKGNDDLYGGTARSFEVRDFTAVPMPRADLIICRDALVHLSYQHIWAALKHFYSSGSKYLLTTTFPRTPENEDIDNGWWRPLNLQISPFSLREPIRVLPDGQSDEYHPDKVLALWELRDLSL
jgi:hypothetical protein